MVRSDYKEFLHSAKGSTWENHKYIKRLDGTYYYPDSYEGGRHLPDNGKEKETLNGEESSSDSLNQSDIKSLAKEVIRGNFGNGEIRKKLLGENYEEVQSLVNIIIRQTSGSNSNKAVEAKTETPKEKKESISKTDSNVHSGVDLNQVLRVYRKEKK